MIYLMSCCISTLPYSFPYILFSGLSTGFFSAERRFSFDGERKSKYHSPLVIKAFVKNEIVFVIALIAAVATAFFNPPSLGWIDAIDFRTLALLFSLMGISEGLKGSAFFSSVAATIERKAGNTKKLSLLLVIIVFISSMFFTNDVSLLIFVPFSMMLLDMAQVDEEHVMRIVVLETISANLGSMTTPVGNPQNLYICSFFGVEAPAFFRTIIPYSIISLLLIVLSFRIFLWKSGSVEKETRSVRKMDKHRTIIYLVFLLAAMFSVFRVISWQLLFVVELIFLLAFDRNILKRIDYILLLTFVAFFIFSENLRSMDAVQGFISSPMASHPVAVSAAVSQIISNVPAAILLSSFTDSFEGVLIGTDIGGLGTPIASLASLISLKFYFRRERGRKGMYMAFFLMLNIVLLAILALFSAIIP